jgi:hypothetical protein
VLLRVAAGVLALLGALAIVLLLVTGPELVLRKADGSAAGDAPNQTVSCYSTFEIPDGLPRNATVVGTDGELNDLDHYGALPDSTYADATCERLRDRRLATAVLLTLPTVLLGSWVIASATVSRRSPVPSS